MLVLSRKKNETIVIGNGLAQVTVVEIRGDKVMLGVVAAKDIPVHRLEIQELIEAQMRAARAQGVSQTTASDPVQPE